MRDREIVCNFYISEGNCSKGRKGTFRKACRTCDKYVKKPGAKPARPNLKREKLDAIRADKKDWRT